MAKPAYRSANTSALSKQNTDTEAQVHMIRRKDVSFKQEKARFAENE